MTEDQQKLAIDILDKALDISVATNRPDGWPQATIVSFVNDGLDIYFGTWSQSQKAANIARDSRVSVTACAPYQAWNEIRAISLAGHAAPVTSPAELARVGELMMKRFGPELAKQTSIDISQTAMFRIRPEIMSLLDYTQGFGHTSQLTVSPVVAAA